MADLVVDNTMLRESETTLGEIARRLEAAEAGRDAAEDIWGSSPVAAAMTAFVDNWNRYRGELVRSLDGIARLHAVTREGFADTDARLRSVLRGGPR